MQIFWYHVLCMERLGINSTFSSWNSCSCYHVFYINNSIRQSIMKISSIIKHIIWCCYCVLKIWFLLFGSNFEISANLPNLIDGITTAEFDNILREFLEYRNVEDFNNVLSALQFQYTYWPIPKNITYVRQETIEVSVSLSRNIGLSVLCSLLLKTIQSILSICWSARSPYSLLKFLSMEFKKQNL